MAGILATKLTVDLAFLPNEDHLLLWCCGLAQEIQPEALVCLI